MAKRFYVVWVGRNPGVYDNWEDAKEQIDNFPNARYKGFGSSAEAAQAFRASAAKEDTEDLGNFLSHSGSVASRLATLRDATLPLWLNTCGAL